MSDYQSKHTGMVIDLCIEKVPILETKLAKTEEDMNQNKTDILLLDKKTVDVVTPQMYGAKGDGVTDDTQAFKTAVATGKNLYIPKGNYYLSETLSYNNLENVKIICYGSIYTKSQEIETYLFDIRNCKNVEIVGLEVESTRDKTGVAPEDHVRTDYSSSNIDPLYIYNCDYVNIRDCVFDNPNYGFYIRGLLDDNAEVKTKVVIDNVTVKNACMGCFVDRLLEFNVTNSSFYMASGLGVGDHAIYMARYIEKVNINSCYFWSAETDTTMGPLVEFGAYEKCIQNASISNCVFSTRIALDIRGNGKYTISDCISKTYSYFMRPCGGLDITITNCQIESGIGVVSPSTAKEQYVAPMNVFMNNSVVNAISLYSFDSSANTNINITVSNCDIKTTDIAIYSSNVPSVFRFINSKFTIVNETAFARYYHTNEMEFIGCKFISVKGLFYCKADIEENKIALINCFVESPNLYRGTEPTQKITCYNSYLNGDLLDKPYVTSEELEAKGYLTEHQSLDGYAKTEDYYTKSETDDKYQPKGNYLTDQDISDKVDRTETLTMVGVDVDGNSHTWTIYGKVVS